MKIDIHELFHIKHIEELTKQMYPERQPDKNCVLVIDANNLAYRSYFGVHGLTTNSGQPTGLIYGFLQSLRTLVDTYVPRRIYIVWDTKDETWRHKYIDGLILKGIYKARYKSGRIKDKKFVQEVYPQIKILQDLLPKLGYFQYVGYNDGNDFYEADDIIASISAMLSFREYIDRVYVVSSDLDFVQLLDIDKVRLLRPKPKSEGEYVVWGKKKVFKEYGVVPKKMVAVGAIMGDKGDNIEGIRGIGIETSLKIIKKYKTLKHVIKRLKAGKIILTNNVNAKFTGVINKLWPNYKLKKLVTRLGIEPPCINLDIVGAQLKLEELEIRNIKSTNLFKGNMDLYFKD